MGDKDCNGQKPEQLRDQHPFFVVVAKKNRAARKKLTKIEELERKIAGQKIQPLPEQLEAINNKQRLLYLVEDYEETLQQMSAVAREDGQKNHFKEKQIESAEKTQDERAQLEIDIASRFEAARLVELSLISKVFRLSEILNSRSACDPRVLQDAIVKAKTSKFATIAEFESALDIFKLVRAAFSDNETDKIHKFLTNSNEALTNGVNYSSIPDLLEQLFEIFEYVQRESHSFTVNDVLPVLSSPLNITSTTECVGRIKEEVPIEEPSIDEPISAPVPEQKPSEEETTQELVKTKPISPTRVPTGNREKKSEPKDETPEPISNKPVDTLTKLLIEAEVPNEDILSAPIVPDAGKVEPVLPTQQRRPNASGNSEVVTFNIAVPKHPSNYQKPRSPSYERSSRARHGNTYDGNRPRNQHATGEDNRQARRKREDPRPNRVPKPSENQNS